MSKVPKPRSPLSWPCSPPTAFPSLRTWRHVATYSTIVRRNVTRARLSEIGVGLLLQLLPGREFSRTEGVREDNPTCRWHRRRPDPTPRQSQSRHRTRDSSLAAYPPSRLFTLHFSYLFTYLFYCFTVPVCLSGDILFVCLLPVRSFLEFVLKPNLSRFFFVAY